MSLNLATLLRTSARHHAAKPAIVLGEAVLTYEQLHRQAQRLAGAFAKLGIQRGQHVALLLPNVPHFTLAYFAAHYAGCPVIPLNVLLTPDEKNQLNLFLGEWLGHCLACGHELEPVL